MKKFAAFFTCLLIGLVSLVGLAGCEKKNPAKINNNIKNVIVLIGDGFGPNHLDNAKKYFNISKFDYENDYVCDVTTYSLNSSVTDSAASATALATGHKANNGEVSWHDGEDYEHLMEIAIKNGKKTGIMTSDSLFGATPACYSAHTENRGQTGEIIKDQIASGIDIFVGPVGGGEYYQPTYQQGFVDNGYIYIDDEEELEDLDNDQKYIALFNSLQSPYNESLTGQIDYPAAITNVLSFLDNEDGFCLMIENAYIDKNSHSNQFHAAMCEVRYFADMIKAVYDFCEGRDDTAVIITADHETGGLQLGSSDSFGNSLYTTGSHTGANVRLFIKYAYIEHKKTVDNTDIFKLCKTLVENKIAS